MGRKISSYDPGDGDGGEFVIAKAGSNYKVTGNAALGPAILDSNEKVISRLAYEGQANGVATLDANGVLVQPASGQLRQRGSWASAADESTTDTVGTPISTLKSGQIALSAGDIVVAIINGVLSNHDGGWAFIRPVISEDGGATWTAVGTYSGVFTPNSSTKIHVSNTVVYVADTDKNVILGVTYGNASGQSGEVHWMSYKQMAVLIFRGVSG